MDMPSAMPIYGQVKGSVKMSAIERMTNRGLLGAFLVNIGCCAVMTTGKAIWHMCPADIEPSRYRAEPI